MESRLRLTLTWLSSILIICLSVQAPRTSSAQPNDHRAPQDAPAALAGQPVYGNREISAPERAQELPPARSQAETTSVPTASQITAGERHTCALTGEGVFCWGDNSFGQLGDGSTTDRLMPTQVASLPNSVTAISAGLNHTCALMATGGVKCWGDNQFGQLGDGTTTNRATPADVDGLTGGVTAVSAGGWHTCAVTAGGGVKCWGRNAFGELGDGTKNTRPFPLDVTGLSSGVRSIAAGGNHTCAAMDTSSARIKCWGANYNGQLGDGTNIERSEPVDVKDLYPGVDPNDPYYPYASGLAAGGSSSFALLTLITHNYHVYAWGNNDRGQLGDGTTVSRWTPEGTYSYTRKVAASQSHTCALGNIWPLSCWGDNTYGQLGDGTTIQRLTAARVTGLDGSVSDIATGLRHSCAVSNGAVKCWGANDSGQLGDDTTDDRLAPVDLAWPVTVDLDIRNGPVSAGGGPESWRSYWSMLTVPVTNWSADGANDVRVDFYDGDPNGGTWLATATVPYVGPHSSTLAAALWNAPHGSSRAIYARVSVQPPFMDIDPANDVTRFGTPIKVFYASTVDGRDFNFDPDTFRFRNWAATWQDFLDYVLTNQYAAIAGIDLGVVRYLPGPVLYMTYARGGHGYGMAQGSIMFWDTPVSRPFGTPAYQLADWQAQPTIRDYHARMMYSIAADQTQTGDPNSAYTILRSHIADQRQPAILAMFTDDPTGPKHAVTAYKIIEVGDTEKKVFLYDSNHPLVTGGEGPYFAVFETGATNRFSYYVPELDVLFTRTKVGDPVRAVDEQLAHAVRTVYHDVARKLIRSARVQVFIGSASAKGSLTDPWGRKIGFVNGTFVNQIPGATMDDLGDGCRFEAPADLQYILSLHGTGYGTLALAFALPLDATHMREVVYDSVPVMTGSVGGMVFNRETTDWTLSVGPGQSQQPDLQRVAEFPQTFLPLISAQ